MRRRRRRKKSSFLKKIFFIIILIFAFSIAKSKYYEYSYVFDGDLIDRMQGLFGLIDGFSASDYKSDDMRKLKRNIKREADNGNDRAKWLYDNFHSLSDTEIYLAGNDSDTIEFVYNNANNISNFDYYPGQSKDLERRTPYFIQWDNRWAYNSLGNSNIGIAGCGPTSMAMALARLNDDVSINPQLIANDAQNYMTSSGISWSFFADEASRYGYSARDISNDYDSIVEALNYGPLIVSVDRGYFTLFGHILLIDSYKDGKFLINDPNSYQKSLKPRSYDQIKDQIAHIWLIS